MAETIPSSLINSFFRGGGVVGGGLLCFACHDLGWIWSYNFKQERCNVPVYLRYYNIYHTVLPLTYNVQKLV